MRDREPLDEDQLKALIDSEIRAADSFYRSELSADRARNLEYYRGVMNDTPAPAGRSQIVSKDVADVMGWILPGIIRVFTASDRMAEYQPVGPEDEESARQATDYCNFVFMKDNPGYRVMWDATHDSLLLGNGVVKHWWDDTEECDYAEMSGVTAEQIALLEQDGAEVTAQKPGEPQEILVPDQQGQMVPQQVQTFDIKTKRVTMSGRIRVECIEPENFLIDKWARCIEEARFTAHRDPDVTKSDLIEMGFDRDIVEQLSPWRTVDTSGESLARNDERWDATARIGDESMQRVELYECYVKVDVDGDGIAETVRAYYAANELLDWEVWDDDVPFSDIPCEPVPHRWDARSIADETVDIQRVKTVMLRGVADNLYAVKSPMMEVEHESVINPEMLVAPKFGGTIWKKKGSNPIIPHVTQFIGDKLLLGLEYLDQIIERRTGVSRATMALDPQTLQNQTATANQNQRDAAYSQIELIARNQAELGWKRVFQQILRLAVKHQDRPRVIRLRNKWIEIDPRYWNAKMDATINVGLGTGSRDRDMAMLQTILGTQIGVAQMFREAMAVDKAIGMIPKIIKTATEMAESSGIRNPDDYYPEISDEDVQAMTQNAQQAMSQPDPKVQMEQAKIQAQVQGDQIKAQSDAQIKTQQASNDLTLAREKAALEAQIQREKNAAEIQLKRETTAAEIQLKREQLAAELELKRELSMQEIEMKRQTGFYAADAKAAVSSVHVGGEPG